MKPYSGKSKPFPSELAQTERRNMQAKIAARSIIIKELEKNITQNTNDISISVKNIESKVDSKISARVCHGKI